MTIKDLPFENRSVWTFLRWNSYLSEKYKLLYIATPKVACTSLKWWFADLEGYAQILSDVKDSKESEPDLVIHDSFHKVAPGVAGLMPDALAEPLVSDAYFRFAVVRNPYKRIFSAWQSKLLLREPLVVNVGSYTEYDFFWMPIKNKTDIALAFEGFLEHLAAREAPIYWDPHWDTQVNLLRPDLIAYTNISQIENTKELKLELLRHLGDGAPDPFSYRRTNESLIPYLPEFITKRADELIRSLYAGDFQTFGYDSQPPESKVEFSVAELDVAIQAIGMIRGRHQRISEIRGPLSRQIDHLNEQIQMINGQIATLIQTIAVLNQAMVERDGQIATLNQSVIDRDWQIAERARQAFNLTQLVAERDRQVASVTAQLNEIINSKSWRLVQILGRIRRAIFGPLKRI